MDPNDPNNGNQSPPSNAGDVNPSDMTLEALYGPSAPMPAADPATQPPMDSPADQMTPPTDPMATAPGQTADPMANAMPQDPMMGSADPGTGYNPQATDPMSMSPVDQTAPGDPLSPTDQYGTGNDDQAIPEPSPDAASFYQGIDPQNQYAMAGPTTPDQPVEGSGEITQDSLPPEETEPVVPPLPPTDDATSPQPTGQLPPIPTRSKLPLILIGVAVALIIVLGLVFVLLKSVSTKKNTPLPTPVATQDTTDPCAIDPTADACQSPGPGATSGGFSSPSPSGSGFFSSPPASPAGSASTKNYTPQQCELLFGGPCPQ